MKQLVGKLHHHLSVVRAVATRRVVRSFADDYGLVYFGSVSQHHDDHRLIHGVTLSKDHRDRHYCVGNIRGYDVVLAQRTDTLHQPARPPKHYTWMIMQFDIRVPEGTFGHFFIDAHHHDDTFYHALTFKFAKLRHVDAAIFAGHEPSFVNGYHVYADTTAALQLPYVLRPDITASLSQHFRHLDFELQGDQLFVYASNVVTTRHSLDHMARAGMWLTECLEATAKDRTFPR